MVSTACSFQSALIPAHTNFRISLRTAGLCDSSDKTAGPNSGSSKSPASLPDDNKGCATIFGCLRDQSLVRREYVNRHTFDGIPDPAEQSHGPEKYVQKLKSLAINPAASFWTSHVAYQARPPSMSCTTAQIRSPDCGSIVTTG